MFDLFHLDRVIQSETVVALFHETTIVTDQHKVVLNLSMIEYIRVQAQCFHLIDLVDTGRNDCNESLIVSDKKRHCPMIMRLCWS